MNSNLSFLFTLPLVCTVCGLPPNIGTVSLCLCGPCFGCVLVDFVRKERAHLGFGTFTLNLNNANALDDHKWFNFVVFWTESPLPELSTITTTISPTSFAQEQFLLPNQRQFGFDHWNLSILSTFLIQSSFLPESGSKCFFSIAYSHSTISTTITIAPNELLPTTTTIPFPSSHGSTHTDRQVFWFGWSLLLLTRPQSNIFL